MSMSKVTIDLVKLEEELKTIREDIIRLDYPFLEGSYKIIFDGARKTIFDYKFSHDRIVEIYKTEEAMLELQIKYEYLKTNVVQNVITKEQVIKVGLFMLAVGMLAGGLLCQ